MSGTRALFASIGASVSLVVAAALSLLAVSAVFAFGGWSTPVADSTRQSALVLTADAAPKPLAAAKPVKLPAPVHGSRQSRAVAHATGTAKSSLRDNAALAQSRSARTHGSIAGVTGSDLSLPQTPAAKPPAAPTTPARKAAGDGVRTAGDDISSKVQNAGNALTQVTDELLPPVTKTVQSVVNILAALLRRTTNGLGGVVDGALPTK
jgi:hypothetical protein